MRMNPEFRRQLWLEISIQRLIVLPVVAIVILGLQLHFNRYMTDAMRAVTVYETFKWGFWILSILWGSNLAANSVASELRERTWNLQKMSPISAWTLTFGKLFGSTVYTWYGSIVCLVISFLAALHTREPLINIKVLILYLEMALFCHGVALLTSLQTLARHQGLSRWMGQSSLVVALLAAIGLTNLILLLTGNHRPSSIIWYSWNFDLINFMIVSMSLFCCWVFIGNWRLMRHELLCKNWPLTWIAFLIFIAVYFNGLTYQIDLYSSRYLREVNLDLTVNHTQIFCSIAYILFWMNTYVMVFSENKGAVLFQRFLSSIKQKNFKQVLEDIPLWLVTLILTTIVMVAFFGLQASGSLTTGSLPIFASSYIFLLRDILIILFLCLPRMSGSGERVALFYLVLLYTLVPTFFVTVIGKEALPYFLPFSDSGDVPNYQQTLAALPGFIIMAILFVWRWRNPGKRDKTLIK